MLPNMTLWSRVPIALIGCVILWCVVFLYEDEERHLRNRIEDWWLSLSEYSAVQTKKAVHFVQAVVQTFDRWMSRFFGNGTHSTRAVHVSAGVSMLALLVWNARTDATSWLFPQSTSFIVLRGTTILSITIVGAVRLSDQGRPAQTVLLSWVMLFMFDTAAWLLEPARRLLWPLLLAPGIFSLFLAASMEARRKPALATSVCIVGWITSLTVFATLLGAGDDEFTTVEILTDLVRTSSFLSMSFVLVAGACNILSIIVTRALVRRASRAATGLELSKLLTIDWMVLALFVIIPFSVSVGTHRPGEYSNVSAYFDSLWKANFTTAIPSMMYAALAAFLVISHAVWPLLLRPLYAVQRFGLPLKHRKTFAGISVGLLAISLIGDACRGILPKWIEIVICVG